MAVVRVDGATGTDVANAYLNDAIFEWQQFGGLSVYRSGGNFHVQAGAWLGGTYVTANSAAQTFGDTLLVEAFFDGTNLGVAVNGVAPTTMPGGAMFVTPVNSRIGMALLGNEFSGRVYEILVYEGSVLTGANRTTAVEYMQDRWLDVTWAASPSGYSGSCTGTDTWSCDLKVFPSNVGDGVETITVTRGTATDDVTIGFYFEESHSCFLSQSVNGSYNAGLSDLDAVATWENLGSSALDVTQGTGAAQPTFRTGIVGGQPVVRCDGGDRLGAATASDWDFVMTAADKTVEHVAIPTAGTSINAMLTAIGSSSGTVNQWFIAHGDLTTNERYIARTYNALGTPVIALDGTANLFPSGAATLAQTVYDDNGGAGNDAFAYLNGAAASPVAAAAAAYGTTAASALQLCSFFNGANFYTGDLFRVLIYQSALTATQRGINKAVDEWALGGTLPVTP
jgi:hypothetical protein